MIWWKILARVLHTEISKLSHWWESFLIWALSSILFLSSPFPVQLTTLFTSLLRSSRAWRLLWRLLGITVTFWWLYNIPERVISLLLITRRRIKAPLFNIWARTKILMSAYLLKVGLWQRPLEALFSSFQTFHFSNLHSERRVRFQSNVCY